MTEATTAGAARLLGPAEIRQLAARLEVRPTKRLGQNFVIDHGTVRRIVALAGLRPEDVVLEVGPGFGSLTLPLLEAAHRVVAVEMDPVLAAALPATAAARAPGLSGRLEVVTADAARVRELPGAPPTVLVANLPYNATVPVLLNVLDRFPSLQHGLVMVQAEVGARMCAPPGSRAYGVSSAKLAWSARMHLAGPVPRTVFWPVPGVESCLVSFGRIDPPQTTASREEVFAVIDAAFGQRRKTLRAALAGWAGSAGEAERLVRAAGLNPGARGEALSVAEFARIAEVAVLANEEDARPGATPGLAPGGAPGAMASTSAGYGPTERSSDRTRPRASGPGERPVSRRAPARGVAGGSGESPPGPAQSPGPAQYGEP